MSMNILNDISKVYLEQVVDEGKVELKQRNKNEMQRKAGNLGREVVSTPNTKKNAVKRTAAMDRMGKLVSAIASDDEDKRFDRMPTREEFVGEGLRSAVKRLLGGGKKKEPEAPKPESRGDELRRRYNTGPEYSDTSVKRSIINRARDNAARAQGQVDRGNASPSYADNANDAVKKYLGAGYSKYGADDKRGSGSKAAKRAAALNKEEFEIIVNALVEEGYDLSSYTWDEMYEVCLDEAGGRHGGGSMVGKPGGPPPRTQGPQNPEDSVYSDEYREKQKNRNKARFGPKSPVEEALQTPKRWWDDDGDGVGYENGEVSGKFKKKKKTRVKKESFSDWRYDLSELMEVIDTKKIKEKKKVGGKIEEGEVDNKELIKINPNLGGVLGEAVEELGGTLLEMVEIEDADCIFDDLSESEVFLLSDNLIEEVVEEFFFECIQEGYGVEEIENVLVESIEISSALLTEADDIKSNRLEKVKSAVKKVGKGLARGVGYVAGAAVRGARAVGREFSKGYERGRGGSSGGNNSPASSPQTSSPQSDTKETGSKRPGLLGRIGSALKSGLKRAVGAGARAVSRGARNVARRMEDGEKNTSSNVPVNRPKAKVSEPEAPKPEPKSVATAAPRSRAKPTAKAAKAATAEPAATAATAAPATKAARKRKISKLEKDELLSSIRNEQVDQIDEVSLPGTGTVMAPSGGVPYVQKKVLGVTVPFSQNLVSPSTGGIKKPNQFNPNNTEYSSAQVQRYNANKNAPSVLKPTEDGPTSVSKTPDKPRPSFFKKPVPTATANPVEKPQQSTQQQKYGNVGEIGNPGGNLRFVQDKAKERNLALQNALK